MSTEIVMPRLSDTMEEGTILRWLKSDGEVVRRGEELVEIETDKAAMVYESDLEGVLKILAEVGATLPVGEPIALVGEAAELAAGNGAAPATSGAPEGSPPAGAPAAAERTPDPGSPGESSLRGASGAVPLQAAGGPAGAGAEGARVRASPLARRIARERSIDLGSIAGTGPGGRVVRADVESAGAAPGGAHRPGAGPAAAPAAPGPAAGPLPQPSVRADDVATAKGTTTTVELTRTQQTVARRMAESRATIPDFSIELEVDMEECVRLRSQLRELAEAGSAQGGEERLDVPTYNDMIVKACALALREHPHANGSYRDGRLQLFSRVNVGVAVATEESLLVPTVFDADEKSLGEIARETHALAQRVRSGAITPPELGGGTFTVSNLGMFGVRRFNAIINPPQAAILSVGSLESRPVARDGELLARVTMSMTLVCDHRVLYGAQAAQFAARIRELLQAPASLTL